MSARKRAVKSDFARIDRPRDGDIDHSIPELDDEVFAQPRVEWPPRKAPITIRLDADVLEWFKQQGRGYQTHINQVLRRYMDVAGEQPRPKGRSRKTRTPSSRRAR